MSFSIAIIGRPNVGKSTIFNKLVGRQMAIVHDMPGVTRDRKEAKGRLGPLDFKVIDTAGLEYEITEQQLESRMVKQTDLATDDADLILLVVDGKTGITADDKYFASWTRRKNKPTVLVVNKCEGQTEDFFAQEYYKLGFGEPIGISAEHNEGFNFLYDAIEPHYDKYNEVFAEHELAEVTDDEKEEDRAIQIAIVGRPNAGKSTFLNSLLGENRLVTGPEAGITRDAISIDWEYGDKKIKLIDTAGIRKKSQVHEKLEKMSLSDSFHAIRFCHVAVLMIDATSPLDKQDLAIASLVVKEGRNIVFAINKWDKVKDKDKTIQYIRDTLEETMPDVKRPAVVTLSALNNRNVDKVMERCLSVYEKWNIRISTGRLNDWLKFAIEEHQPPLYKGKPVKLKYVTQCKRRPPAFALFTNNPDKLKGAYERYLLNSIRDVFDLYGIPLRIILRKAENPYEDVRYKHASAHSKDKTSRGKRGAPRRKRK